MAVVWMETWGGNSICQLCFPLVVGGGGFGMCVTFSLPLAHPTSTLPPTPPWQSKLWLVNHFSEWHFLREMIGHWGGGVFHSADHNHHNPPAAVVNSRACFAREAGSSFLLKSFVIIIIFYLAASLFTQTLYRGKTNAIEQIKATLIIYTQCCQVMYK